LGKPGTKKPERIKTSAKKRDKRLQPKRTLFKTTGCCEKKSPKPSIRVKTEEGRRVRSLPQNSSKELCGPKTQTSGFKPQAQRWSEREISSKGKEDFLSKTISCGEL